jgi:CheY-like chemotaxis protein
MKILICDDSGLARKSLARTITLYTDHPILFAEHETETLEIIKAENIDILFLDLTMPVMDGFEVLAHLPITDHPLKTIVVSGDVQQQAIDRCYSLGAYGFIKKPFEKSKFESLIEKLGLIEKQDKTNDHQDDDLSPTIKFKEICNVALGAGAAVVSDFIGEFITLPIPNVGPLESSELDMMITDALDRETSIAVAQRFVGSGLHGEAIVCMEGTDIALIGEKLGFSREHSTFNEIVLNIGNLLVASFLTSLSKQLNVDVVLRQPATLTPDMYKVEDSKPHAQVFTIEFTYRTEHLNFECEVLFLLDDKSRQAIYDIMETF